MNEPTQRKAVGPFALPLLLICPASGYFAGPYLDGRGFLPDGTGLLVGGLSMFVLPIVVSIVMARSGAVRSWPRAGVFVSALFISLALVFTVPPAVKSGTIGMAHRFRKERSIAMLSMYAAQIVSAYPTNKMADDVVKRVEDSNLPSGIRGKFQRVEVWMDGSKAEVFFFVTARSGIVCNSNDFENLPSRYSIASGVHAFNHIR